jgi:hypothetical protein
VRRRLGHLRECRGEVAVVVEHVELFC